MQDPDARGLVVVPGNFGTVIEMAMVWQLLQVGKLSTPLILIGRIWYDLVAWGPSALC